MKTINYLVLILVAFNLSCGQNNAPVYPKKELALNFEKDDKSISVEELMEDRGLKGLSVAVFDDYKIIWKGAWGVKYDSVPLNEETSFSTASISKAVTGLLFTILEEKGLLDLNVPVNNYLKRWKIPKNEFNKDTPVTLKHLLSHTAGTTQHGFADFYLGEKVPTILESVQGKLPRYDKEIEVVFKPGTSWKYSGGGYTIAMMALEDHLGQSLADLAQEYIFGPLNLKNTTMKQPNEEGFLTNVAKAHNNKGIVIKTGIPITPQVSASGMWSNPTDMSVLMIEIQKALEGKSKIFSKKVAQRVTDVITRKVRGGWSLGFERFLPFGNLDWFSHGGANTGTGGYIYGTMKEGKGMVFFGNGPNSAREPVLNELMNNIIKTHNWKKPFDRSKIKKLPATLEEQIVGRYEHVSWGLNEIKKKDGKLYFILSKDYELLYLGNNTFALDEFQYKMKFTMKENGQHEIEQVWDDSDEKIFMQRKILGKLPFEFVLENNYEEALAAYKKLKRKNPNSQLVTENGNNNYGYKLLGEENYDAAIIIFKINTVLYPESANTYDSLGEAYLLSGDKKNALKYYKKTLELNPNNPNAVKIVKELSE